MHGWRALRVKAQERAIRDRGSESAPTDEKGNDDLSSG